MQVPSYFFENDYEFDRSLLKIHNVDELNSHIKQL